MSEPFIGQIIMFGGTFAPKGWAFCNGELLAIDQYQSLYSILGTIYGGDGRSTFALPDLRSRMPVHVGGTSGQGAGLPTVRLGEKSGNYEVTITTNQMPSHNHSANLRGINQTANSTGFSGSALGNASTNLYYNSRGGDSSFVNLQSDSVTVDSTGGGNALNIMNPFLGINFIIALVGTYPSRN